MNQNVKLSVFIFLVISITKLYTQDIIEAGANLEKCADNLKFGEGPASDNMGNVFFTDQPNDRILIWNINDSLLTFLQPCGRANGLCFDNMGNLWACADEQNQLWKIDKMKNITVLVKNYKNLLLNGPNDIWISPNGGVYFTDPFYKRAYWERENMEQDCQGVYYLSPDSKNLTRVIDDLLQPNGIIGTPDGSMLYVTDIRGQKTYSYKVESDGSLANKTLFCEMGSDGMTIDNLGNIYLTGKGVTVFNNLGDKITHIDVNEPWTANVCFGGKDKKTLYITASTALYRLRMTVSGVGSQ